MSTFEKINPSDKNTIITTANNLKEAEKIYDGYIKEATNRVLKDNLIDIAKLLQTHSPQSVLFEILSPLGFTPSVVEDISNNLDSIPGKVYLADNYRLLKDRDYLVISETKPDNHEENDEAYLILADTTHMERPFELTIKSEIHGPEFEIERNNAILQCDLDKLSFPLTLRRWKKGDWFVPFGMKGKKKISDFFTDNKFTLFEKEETWILLSANDIVWVVNHRLDNRFRVTDATKSIYTIKFAKQS